MISAASLLFLWTFFFFFFKLDISEGLSLKEIIISLLVKYWGIFIYSYGNTFFLFENTLENLGVFKIGSLGVKTIIL